MVWQETIWIHRSSDLNKSLQLIMAQYQLHLSLFTLLCMDKAGVLWLQELALNTHGLHTWYSRYLSVYTHIPTPTIHYVICFEIRTTQEGSDKLEGLEAISKPHNQGRLLSKTILRPLQVWKHFCSFSLTKCKDLIFKITTKNILETKSKNIRYSETEPIVQINIKYSVFNILVHNSR